MKSPALAVTCNGRKLSVSAETGGAFRIRYALTSQSPAEAISWLADISGHAPVPPRWVLGFMHSRWGCDHHEPHKFF